jgi:transposase-like protein
MDKVTDNKIPTSFADYIGNPRCLKCGSPDYYRARQESIGEQRLLWSFHCHSCGSSWAVTYDPVQVSGNGTTYAGNK